MRDSTAPDRGARGLFTQAVVGVFSGPWDTGWAVRDGAVLGFEDSYHAFVAAAEAGEFKLLATDIGIFRDYRRIRDFLAASDTIYANCGPWAALLYLVRDRERLDVHIIREVRTVGWVGYIWQEEIALPLERPGDQRVFPSRYARDVWDSAAPSASGSRVYYPIIHRGHEPSRPVERTPGAVGFFSALTRDKGFDQLPGVIARLRAGGHRVERVILAGQQSDPALFDAVAGALADLSIAVDYRGGLPNGAARELMAACQTVLFPSVSSLESLGRIMVEASEQGVPVITGDFGAARDLVHADYRIPVRIYDDACGPSASAFPVARLDLDCWTPPATLSSQACFLPAVENYRIDALSPADILRPAPATPPAALPVTISFHSEVSALRVATELLNEIATLRYTPDHEMLDLGGALKHFLLSRGYNPTVSFTAEALPHFRGRP